MMKSGFVVCSMLLVLAAGCGPESLETPPPEVVYSTLTGTVVVPESFTGTPVQLAITGYESVPPTHAPDAIFSLVLDPVIGVGQDYSFTIADITETGRYHVMAALYLAGGDGGPAPNAGTDYVGWTTESFPFSEGGVFDVGAIRLSIYQPGPR